MGYDCGDSFPFDFETNGNPIGSENRKKNCHHDHISFNLKGNRIRVFSVLVFQDERLLCQRSLFIGFGVVTLKYDKIL